MRLKWALVGREGLAGALRASERWLHPVPLRDFFPLNPSQTMPHFLSGCPFSKAGGDSGYQDPSQDIWREANFQETAADGPMAC